jgi:hypothetical protein
VAEDVPVVGDEEVTANSRRIRVRRGGDRGMYSLVDRTLVTSKRTYMPREPEDRSEGLVDGGKSDSFGLR